MHNNDDKFEGPTAIPLTNVLWFAEKNVAKSLINVALHVAISAAVCKFHLFLR